MDIEKLATGLANFSDLIKSEVGLSNAAKVEIKGSIDTCIKLLDELTLWKESFVNSLVGLKNVIETNYTEREAALKSLLGG